MITQETIRRVYAYYHAHNYALGCGYDEDISIEKFTEDISDDADIVITDLLNRIDELEGEKVAEELSDILVEEIEGGGEINNQTEYDNRIRELLEQHRHNALDSSDVDTLVHDKLSFGPCDICSEIIFYENASWYDLGMSYKPEEQEKIEKNLPKVRKKHNREVENVQVICAKCFNEIMYGEEK